MVGAGDEHAARRRCTGCCSRDGPGAPSPRVVPGARRRRGAGGPAGALRAAAGPRASRWCATGRRRRGRRRRRPRRRARRGAVRPHAGPGLAAHLLQRADRGGARRAGGRCGSEPEVAREGRRGPDRRDDGAGSPRRPPDAALRDARRPVADGTDLPGGTGVRHPGARGPRAARPTAPTCDAELAALRAPSRSRASAPGVDADALAAALLPSLAHTARPAGRRPRAAPTSPPRDRLAELDFELPLAGGDDARRAARRCSATSCRCCARAPRRRRPARRLRRPRSPPLADAAAARLPHRQHRRRAARRPAAGRATSSSTTRRTGSARRPTAEPLTAWHYRPARWPTAMIDAHYPLQALLYAVALHRFLRWRQPGYDPRRHLGGVLYLFLRGMCGPGRAGGRRGAVRRVLAGGRPPRWSSSCPTCSTGVPVTASGSCAGRPARRRAWPAPRPGLLARLQRAPACWSRADVHVASALGRLGGETDDDVLLALALAVRGVRRVGVLDLAAVRAHGARRGRRARRRLRRCPGPTRRRGWRRARRARCVAGRGQPDAPGAVAPLPAALDGLLYLDRYWRQEELVRSRAGRRTRRRPPPARSTSTGLRAGLAAAVRRGAATRGRTGSGSPPPWPRSGRVTVLAGGRAPARPPPSRGCWRCCATSPGGLRRGSRWPRRPARRRPGCRRPCRGRAASTGRLRLARRTLHRLLGLAPGREPVPARPDDRLPLRRGRRRRDVDGVADDDGPAARGGAPGRPAGAGRRPGPARVGRGRAPSSATSPAPPAGPNRTSTPRSAGARPARRGRQRRGHAGRTSGGSAGRSPAFARAVQAGDADAAIALLRGGTRRPGVRRDRVAPPPREAVRADVVDAGGRAGRRGRGAATCRRRWPRWSATGVLCGHRRGPYGVARWSREIERWLADGAAASSASDGEWYPGRPVLVTANDYDTGLYNGDTGVVVATAGRPAGRVPRRGRAARPVPARGRSRPCTR